MSARGLLAAGLLLGACACGPGAEETPVELAARVPSVGTEREGVRGAWIPALVPAASWTAEDGAWRAPDPFEGSHLRSAAEVAPRARGDARPLQGAEGLLRLAGKPDAPPGDVVVERFCRTGRRTEPALPGEAVRWRVRNGPLASDGFALPPGGTRSFRVRLSGPARLRFASSAAAPAGAKGVVLTVRVDGQPALQRELAGGDGGAVRTHDLAIPASASGEHTLVFESAGEDALAFVHVPRVVAADVAAARARDPRPDVVLVVVDTLRADAVGARAGAVALTPTLDALAGESLDFRNAFASSAWTLPSHASLFTGLHPRQHGATEPDRTVPPVVTLAELLSAAGYRTAAVTNGAFVSASYGMDRGFSWFQEESPTDLDGTLRAALALLERGDGRPTFLFVHTYRVHTPYRRDPAETAAVAAELGTDAGDAAQLALFQATRAYAEEHAFEHPLLRLVRQGLFSDVLASAGAGDAASAEARFGAPLHHLYLSGVAALDRGLGAFLAGVHEQGLDGNLALLLTSDHGEAFGEDGDWFHGHGVGDAVLRVPLLIRVPDLPAGVRDDAASTVDLAPTIAALAGVAPWRRWVGRSLLTPSDAPVLAFDCAAPESASMAVLTPEWRLELPDRAGTDPTEDGARLVPAPGQPPLGTAEAAALRRRILAEVGERLRAARRGPRETPAVEGGNGSELEKLGY